MPKRLLLLTGPMGAGKSTVGRLVGGDRFLDLDEVIVAKTGKPIAKLFAEKGEAAFRALERAALEALLADHEGVIALGGGALLDRALRLRALDRAHVVSLIASAETLAARIEDDSRPLLVDVDRVATLRALIAERADVYAEAHSTISTEALSPAAVADLVAAAWQEPRVAVALGSRSYPVRFVDDAAVAIADSLDRARAKSFAFVTDANVAPLYLDALRDRLARAGREALASVVLPAGEANKTLASFERAHVELIEARADRSTVIVALGGGVVTDLAGFVAATLFRGVRWIAVPTTALAMIDASVGGKTGVDLGEAKNAIGAFHQPIEVLIDVGFTRTESNRAFVSGLAEAIKAAFLGADSLLESLETNTTAILARERRALAEVIERAVALKATIVARDEHESGERMLLNFGHTLGHALESHGRYERLTHGEAVSIGMRLAARIGVELAITPRAIAARLEALLDRYALAMNLTAEPIAEAARLLHFDKKRADRDIREVFLVESGAIIRAIGIDSLTKLALSATSFQRTLPHDQTSR